MDGDAVNVAFVPAHMDELAAEAPTNGESLTVRVNGTDAETQPVVLFLTTKIKSYTPATTEVCLLTE